MPDIFNMMSDIGRAGVDGYNHGRQVKENKRTDSARLLYGQASQGDKSALEQLYGVDPASALKVKESNEGDRVKGAQFMHRAATILKNTNENQRAAVYSRMMQEAKANPYISEFTQGLPDQYDPTVMQHVDGLIGMSGMYQEPDNGGMVQSTKVGNDGYYYTVDRNRNWVNSGIKAQQNLRTFETREGVNTFNPNGGATEPLYEGQPHSGTPAPPIAPVGVGTATGAGRSVPPLAKDMQAGDTWDDSSFTSLPPEEQAKFNSFASQGTPFQLVGGKIVASPVQGKRVMAPAKAFEGKQAPGGYEYTAEGSLKPIRGGPADPSTKASVAALQPLPVAAVKLIEEAQDSLAAAAGTNELLADYDGRIKRGDLKLGLFQNAVSTVKNYTNSSNKNSQNFASFQAMLEKMRNQSLTLNKGVQTDGDAQRAWNELMASLNDEGVVKQRLAEIQELNVRAAHLQREKISRIQRNYGGQKPATPSAPTEPVAGKKDHSGLF